MNQTRSFGIRERLFLAFGSVAAMTVVASTVAWFSFTKLSDNLDQIVADNIPAVTLAARLAEIGGVISATAPTLALAEDEEERDRAWKALSNSLENFEQIIDDLNAGLIGPEIEKSLRSIIDRVALNLSNLNRNAVRRFRFEEKNEDLTERLRWAHADFLDEIEPMVSDSRFAIDVELEVMPRTPTQLLNLRLETLRQEALLRLNATGNLVIGLIARAAIAPNRIILDDTAFFLRDVSSRIDQDLEDVRGISGSLSLHQALQDILTYADGSNSLFQLRRNELENQSEGRKLVSISLNLVEHLQELINQRVEAGHLATITATESSRKSTRQEKLLLLVVAALSLVVAILVVWLYVGRNLVRRITSLDAAMGAIAEGDLATAIPTGGKDEISDMAGSLSTFRDTLVETQAELVQAGKLAALGQLSAGVAHELNQPLAAIRSYAHNTRRLIEKGSGEEAIDTLSRVSELVERMGATINHLRNLARRPSSALEAVEIKSVIENALILLDARVRDENIKIVRKFPDQEILVHAEAIRLEQVLINLFANAVDSMADSHVRELDIVLLSTISSVAVHISDSGCGISEQDLEYVFDPFFTTKSVGEGLGLGLSISYNIIKDFNGTVRVKSDIGVGTTFTIVLNNAYEAS